MAPHVLLQSLYVLRDLLRVALVGLGRPRDYFFDSVFLFQPAYPQERFERFRPELVDFQAEELPLVLQGSSREMSDFKRPHFLRQCGHIFAKVVERSEPLLNLRGMAGRSVDEPEVNLFHGDATYSKKGQMSGIQLLLHFHGSVFYLVYVEVASAHRFRAPLLRI